MTYPELIEYMHAYRNGDLTRDEFICAFYLWRIAQLTQLIVS